MLKERNDEIKRKKRNESLKMKLYKHQEEKAKKEA